MIMIFQVKLNQIYYKYIVVFSYMFLNYIWANVGCYTG